MQSELRFGTIVDLDPGTMSALVELGRGPRLHDMPEEATAEW